MRRTRIVLGLAMGIAAISSGGDALADDAAIRVSCTAAGTIVYRADLPAGTSAARRLEIAADNPDALCVFLKADGASGRAVDTALDPAPGVMPGASSGDPDDLATALSFLSTGQEIGAPYGQELQDSMPAFLKSGQAFSKPANTVNLTIGIYKDMSPEEVMENWTTIAKTTAKLGKLTPSVQKVDDVTVLNVEHVPDQDAAQVCEEAERVASGCVATY